MRGRNHQVVSYWAEGTSATNHRGSLTTDGVSLWSYSLKIGDTLLDGRKVVSDFTAAGSGGFKSQTTSCHVGQARRVANVVV